MVDSCVDVAKYHIDQNPHSHCSVARRSLGFDDTPDYERCRKDMMHAFKEVTGREEVRCNDFEWLTPRQSESDMESRRKRRLESDLFS